MKESIKFIIKARGIKRKEKKLNKTCKKIRKLEGKLYAEREYYNRLKEDTLKLIDDALEIGKGIKM